MTSLQSGINAKRIGPYSFRRGRLPRDRAERPQFQFDPAMPYQVVQLMVLGQGSTAANEARAAFERALQTLRMDYAVTGIVANQRFTISNRCQRYWMMTDISGQETGPVVFILQEPHWDYVAHWNLRQGLAVFFEDNPHLVAGTTFLAEGLRSGFELPLEPLVKAEPRPTEDMIHAILQSYLITGYIAYAWELGGRIRVLGTEDWPLYKESVNRWLTDQTAPWAVTVAARNAKMVETLVAIQARSRNPMLFVGGMHLYRISADTYSKGQTVFSDASSMAIGVNEGIIDHLRKRGIRYVYIEPVPSTRAKAMASETELARYRALFHAQENGNYGAYISQSAASMQQLEIYGNSHPSGVTVSPTPSAAATLISLLRVSGGDGGNDDAKKNNRRNDGRDDDQNRKDAGRSNTARNTNGPKSPLIDISEITNKTRAFLRNLATLKGLEPDPNNDPGDPWKPETYNDPVTHKERLRIERGHIEVRELKATDTRGRPLATSAAPYDDPKAKVAHVHARDASGGFLRDKDYNKHFPLGEEDK